MNRCDVSRRRYLRICHMSTRTTWLRFAPPDRSWSSLFMISVLSAMALGRRHTKPVPYLVYDITIAPITKTEQTTSKVRYIARYRSCDPTRVQANSTTFTTGSHHKLCVQRITTRKQSVCAIRITIRPRRRICQLAHQYKYVLPNSDNVRHGATWSMNISGISHIRCTAPYSSRAVPYNDKRCACAGHPMDDVQASCAHFAAS